MHALLTDKPVIKWPHHSSIIDIPLLIINIKPGECEQRTRPGAISRFFVTILFACKKCRTKGRLLRSLGTYFFKQFTFNPVQLISCELQDNIV
jgi:hypothetical protein